MRSSILVFGVVAAIAATSSFAQQEFSVGAKLGTLGLGVELTKEFKPNINGRIGLNKWSIDRDGTEDDIKYKIELELKTIAAMLDWFPMGGAFRVTGGLFSNGNELNMTGESQANYTIGNTTYSSSDIGSLTGKVDFKSVAPYLGVGWGNVVKDRGWNFAADVGVLFQGSPKVDLQANLTPTSPVSASDLEADVQREENQLESDLDSFDMYPVLSLIVAYRF